MQGQKTINVSISPVGKPTIEANGFNGVGCKDATAAIEQALAGTGTDAVLCDYKPEYDATHEETVVHHASL